MKARDSGPTGGVRFRVNLGDNWVAVWHGVVFFYKRRLPASTERPEVPLNEAKKRKLLLLFINYLYLYTDCDLTLMVINLLTVNGNNQMAFEWLELYGREERVYIAILS